MFSVNINQMFSVNINQRSLKCSYPVGKIAEECIFDNMAMYFECRSNKNGTVFLAILPTIHILNLLRFCKKN